MDQVTTAVLERNRAPSQMAEMRYPDLQESAEGVRAAVDKFLSIMSAYQINRDQAHAVLDTGTMRQRVGDAAHVIGDIAGRFGGGVADVVSVLGREVSERMTRFVASQREKYRQVVPEAVGA